MGFFFSDITLDMETGPPVRDHNTKRARAAYTEHARGKTPARATHATEMPSARAPLHLAGQLSARQIWYHVQRDIKH
ncbi:hypothetical protein BaRGS_00014926 [Batillaria attramentaria]|uniref:Uncharacterized protein n=1 Tax=Batillaria attramentaria TaxID=370345 RepID=A0ABD0L375_9CAEN